MKIRYYRAPIGMLRLGAEDGFLTEAVICNSAERLAEENDGVFLPAFQWLDAYFRGEKPDINAVPLRLKGTQFQRRVWELLLTIPYGEVRTYGQIAAELARQMGKEQMSAQAVGQAVGSNPIGIFVPCHRVVGAKGKLTGYAWGLERKRWLLRHEEHAYGGGNPMTVNEYQTLAMTTLNPELSKKDILINGVMGLCGESGEAIDLVKKWLAQGHALDKDALTKELGDIAWYLAETAYALEVPLEDVFRKNLDKLKKRYPDGFSSQKSMTREE